MSEWPPRIRFFRDVLTVNFKYFMSVVNQFYYFATDVLDRRGITAQQMRNWKSESMRSEQNQFLAAS
jgi:hypothetical protein